MILPTLQALPIAMTKRKSYRLRMRKFLLLVPATLLVIASVVFVLRPSGTTVEAQKANGSEEKFFLKLDGVDGESMEGDHVGEIMVQSFSWDQNRPFDTSGKIQIQPFHVVIPFDKSTPILLRKMGARERIGKAVLTARSGSQDYLKIVMGDVIIASYQIEGTWGLSRPLVGLDLIFTKIDQEYRYRLPNGGLGPTVKGSWILSQ